MRRSLVIVALFLLLLGAALGAAQVPQLFTTSDRCMACHNGLVTPSGEDISIGVAWRPTMIV